MKIFIEIECDNAAFTPRPYEEVRRILDTIPKKIHEQLRRPKSLCDHPESSDKLLDINGNTVGHLRVEK